MQGLVLVELPSTEALLVRLQLSLHGSTDSDNVSTHTSVNEVILDLTVNGLGQGACIDVLHVIVYLLDADSLVEGSLGGMLLRVEDLTSAVNVYASVGHFPLKIVN